MSTRTIFGSGEFLRGNDRAGGSLDPEAVRVVFSRITEITEGTSEAMASTQGANDRKIDNVQKLLAEDDERRKRQATFNTGPQEPTLPVTDSPPALLDRDAAKRQVDDIHDQIHGEG